MQRTEVAVAPIPDLRARRRRQTELEIHTAAITLAAERGADRVTVDDIAALAGVSARTFFRYFPTRDRALVYDRWGFDDAVDALFARHDPREVRMRDVETVYEHGLARIKADPDPDAATTIYRTLSASTQLMAAATAAANERTAALLDTIPAAERIRVRLLLGVARTVLFTAFAEWVESGSPTASSDSSPLLEVYRRLCREVRSL
ncbi:TetR family transcriptional regulator [Nocardia brasiliensis]|uniref:TetR family transcriptional regulator n=1 Tax=Nocardia brasiliensis TaxID=37326 RepID=A0A6G9XTF4_NOCBR|nr:TetR/AcrR family transcriptional regulator [Nocardia brasiliensis]QIS04186.1 TetR family transcriptional regulator [Nocardia brasiliensis]